MGLSLESVRFHLPPLNNRMHRREFTFWLGMGLFSLSDRLCLGGFDRLAALAMQATEPPKPSAPPTHWQRAENEAWAWYERETLIGDKWKLSGITTPINKATGERYTGKTGYLEDSLIPEKLGREKPNPETQTEHHSKTDLGPVNEFGKVKPGRRARHGRPPSQWLRSLESHELRVWLRTIKVPEAGVSGMTFWTHLTRDHSFSPTRIEGLSEPELAKLHSAAHHGY